MAGDALFWDMDTCARDARESIASRGGPAGRRGRA